MSNIVIQVENLSKQYRLGAINHGTLRRDLQSWWASLRGKDDPNSRVGARGHSPGGDPLSTELSERFWALKDVSFTVQQGEIVGIIGRNGAGKSTLLKILSQITTPTAGEVRIKGRIASLLEVGTGFHPELTGRENVFLNGAILGMSKEETRRKLDEIIAFAEIEKFIDTPVKRYSSGMYVRLAFAVAAHLEPEILIIDEVLAVGDAEFQKKCLGKMEDVGKEGRTVLFVSHNMGAIHALTHNCAFLDKGQLVFFGVTREAVNIYLTESMGSETNKKYNLNYYRREYVEKAYENDIKIRYEDIWVEVGGKRTSELEFGSDFYVYFDLNVYSKINGASISFSILNADAQYVTVIYSWDYNYYISIDPGKRKIILKIENLNLTPGKYFIITGINQSSVTTPWDAIFHFPLFEVKNTGKVIHWLHRPWGSVYCDNVQWVTES